MNNKIILGLTFALSFSLFIGSSHHAYAGAVGNTGIFNLPSCFEHSHPAPVGVWCICDDGFKEVPEPASPRPTCIPISVGGMGFPIDSTALLLAGVQGSTFWMILVIVTGTGIGLVLFTRKKKKQY